MQKDFTFILHAKNISQRLSKLLKYWCYWAWQSVSQSWHGIHLGRRMMQRCWHMASKMLQTLSVFSPWDISALTVSGWWLTYLDLVLICCYYQQSNCAGKKQCLSKFYFLGILLHNSNIYTFHVYWPWRGLVKLVGRRKAVKQTTWSLLWVSSKRY